ncbi:MAG: DUF4389 domain-containing protein [Gammaproteobacteria bacterium]|nr:DUF4389 domain-containing protein [Gammaproteobacteria bacterium]
MKKELLTATDTWVRGLYMLLYVCIFWLAKLVAFGVALLQFLILLATGQTNARLSEFGKRLSVYMYQLLLYLTFATHDKPFPFSEWPLYVPLQPTPPAAPENPDKPL